jgi:hypothetical protein
MGQLNIKFITPNGHEIGLPLKNGDAFTVPTTFDGSLNIGQFVTRNFEELIEQRLN